jgi:glyoxylase-like metal-dependent hydrolase (beta-lactamase superfamily II)
MNRPEFPNSAIIRAPECLVLKGGGWRRLAIPVHYGIWRHPSEGHVLIDTGYAPRVTEGRSRMMKIYNAMLSPRLLADQLPLPQLAARGVAREDVRTIVVTHFHADHIAGLKDFPNARFLASGAAWKALKAMTARQRLHHGVFMELLPDDFSARLVPFENYRATSLPGGLGAGFDLFSDASCLAVPLAGHALGHFGLLWPEPALLYAVDTQWLWRAIAENRPPRGPARLVFHDWKAALASSALVRDFARQGGEVMLCHDPDGGSRALQ